MPRHGLVQSNTAFETDASAGAAALRQCAAQLDRYVLFAGDRWLWQDSGKLET